MPRILFLVLCAALLATPATFAQSYPQIREVGIRAD
jgi:hypothetical protein